MKFFEYMAKEVFRERGIPTPRGRVAATPDEAARVAEEVGGPVAVKSQVLAGGRGKAGGIRFADTPDQARQVAADLLGQEVRGYRVERVLVEEKLRIDRELYLGIAVDTGRKLPLVIASVHGGVNIEEVPEKDIVKRPVDITLGLYPYFARGIARRLGLEGAVARQFADLLTRLYRIFRDYDAELVEINPLVISGDRLIAADGRLNIDDDSRFRHEDLPEVSEATELERRVREIGLSYVELDGDIAVMANGAGITMATIDVLTEYGGRAMNFLDAGGGAAVEPMAKAMAVLVSTNPKAIFVNIFGGITRCDDVANAIVTVKRQQGIPVPLVVRLVGTNEDKGVAILREHGIEAFRDMGEAARKAVELARQGGER
ncbi:ADP-forming succinate--CoA ligase subunit beta [Thermaerobacter sp. PB12/4term]|uniref:ADP-forming succinate--CoA ligase subunit beta n=1 Tax=Thermaerobacter sp. PB12/4term TaxID=2293838 RepID=UPI000E32B6FC|nr:ADP-forming succinate--CoA ligase subunit beta [Thermaerobacter sp. PB12/4term]QIA27183.1 ADP-forming succinate--CoA ligase subunit beta [Thermaerobacter sp. PB12/4term]